MESSRMPEEKGALPSRMPCERSVELSLIERVRVPTKFSRRSLGIPMQLPRKHLQLLMWIPQHATRPKMIPQGRFQFPGQKELASQGATRTRTPRDPAEDIGELPSSSQAPSRPRSHRQYGSYVGKKCPFTTTNQSNGIGNAFFVNSPAHLLTVANPIFCAPRWPSAS